MDKTQWLEERRKGIGGSDSPAIFGVSPFRNALDVYYDKLGIAPPEPETPAMARGAALEPIAADLYAKQTGYQLEMDNANFVHPHIEFITVNTDRRIVSSAGDGVLEIKCPGLHVFSRCKREGLPDYYIIQLQHGMGVTGRKWGAFAVFSAERWELLHFEVKRDDALIDMIFDADIKFWKEHIEKQIPPTVSHETMPEIPPIGGEVVTLNTKEMATAVEELRIANEIMAEAKGLREYAEKHIKALMAENNTDAIELTNRFRGYWRQQDGRKSLDKKRMIADGIDLSKYEKTGKPFKVFKPYFLTKNSIE